jgi:hypothetical protein
MAHILGTTLAVLRHAEATLGPLRHRDPRPGQEDPDLDEDLRLRRSRSASTYLDGVHGRVESSEAAVEGTKDGDDGISDLLALVEGLMQQRRTLCKGLHLPVESMLTCGGREEGSGVSWMWDWRSSSASGDLVEKETRWMVENPTVGTTRNGYP